MGRARQFRTLDHKARRRPRYEPTPPAPSIEARFARPEPITALTARQEDLIQSINENELTVVMGPAGTGKTFVAAAMAADMLADGTVSKLILCRPAVEAEEHLGFLPGDIKRKLEPWVIPFTEVIERRLGKQRFMSLQAAGVIEVVPFAYMRGRTFADAVVILDEAQNTTYGQMKLFLTRIGEGATVIINGDVEQSDLPVESGLAIILRMIEAQRLDTPVIEFTTRDVVRSGLCRVWTEAFIQHEKALK